MKSRALNLAVWALLAGLCGWTAGGARPAAAQALDAGKPPGQIFSGTCSACHRSPRGLVRSISPRGLQGFLRQHYTTGSEMAGTMAAYVLGNGGTDRVAEPPPKREPRQEPRQRPKSDAPDVAARNPDQKEQSKSAKQRAAKKGAPEQPPAAKDAASGPEPEPKPEPEQVETSKPETPAEPPKAETAAVECKVDEPAQPAAAATPSRQPTARLILPGFPEPEPEPEPEPVAAAPVSPDCDPPASTAATAEHTGEAAKEQDKQPPPSAAPTDVAEGPKAQPAAGEPAVPVLDIMQEEVHEPRPARSAGQKRRTQQ